jgi:hypothetical protein
MKNLKYIKLFEAFESQKLSKTLGFINKDSRAYFIDDLKKLCSRLDFPISKLNDDFFLYLPFKKALNLVAQKSDTPCDATSQGQFPEHGIEGETCQGGKMKRMWGARVREVTCPKCQGTGIKPEKPEIKWIKFWFSAEGEYVESSSVDGSIRSNRYKDGKKKDTINSEEFEEVGVSSLDELQTGDYFKIKLATSRDYTTCVAFREGRKLYALQNDRSGDSPDGDWHQYKMTYSWILEPNQYSGNPILLKKKVDSEQVEEEPDPYTWNRKLEIGRYGIDTKESDLEKELKDAHFALCLDFDKMKKSGYKPKSATSGAREESREGALALEKPEEIKKANLQRYLDGVANKLKIEGISDVKNILPRILGGRWSFWYFSQERGMSEVSSIISRLFTIAKEEDKSPENLEYEFRRINSTLRDTYQNNVKRNALYSQHMDAIRKEATKEGNSDPIEIIDLIEQLSKAINEKYLEKIETLEDLELQWIKIKGLIELIRGERFGLRALRYLSDRIGYEDTSRSYTRLTTDYIRPDEVIEGLEKVISIVKRY